MARLKSGWSNRGRGRSLEDIGGALSFNIWQLSGQGVLDLENEGFQTDTQAQRLDVISEYSAFLLQIADRMVHARVELEDRNKIINAAGLHLAGIMQDNRLETNGPGEYTQDYLASLNTRIVDYSKNLFDSKDGPSFVYLRLVGDYVTAQMGEKDAKWITSYIIDIAGPKLFKNLRRLVPGLIDPARKIQDEDIEMRKMNYDR